MIPPPEDFTDLPDWLVEPCATALRSAHTKLMRGRKVMLTYYAVTNDGKITPPMVFPEDQEHMEAAHMALKMTVELCKPRAIIRIAEAWMLMVPKDGNEDNVINAGHVSQNPQRMDVLHISVECSKGGFYVGWSTLKRDDDGKVIEIEPVRYMHSNEMDSRSRMGAFFDHTPTITEEPEEYNGGPIGFSA